MRTWAELGTQALPTTVPVLIEAVEDAVRAIRSSQDGVDLLALLVGRVAGDDLARVWVALGALRADLGDAQGALDAFAAGLAVAESGKVRGHVLVWHACFAVVVDVPNAGPLAQRGLDELGRGDSRDLVYGLVVRALVEAQVGDARAATADMGRAGFVAGRLRDEKDEWFVLTNAIVCFSFLGMPGEGVRAARAAIAKARTSRLLRSFFAQMALGNAALTLRSVGSWDEVLTLTWEVWGEVVPDTDPATALHFASAGILTSRGDSAAAVPLVEHLISVMRAWPADSALARGMRGRLHLLAGEHEIALDAVEDGFATCRLDQPEVFGPTGLLFICDALAVAAEVSTVPGLRDRAVRVVETLDAARAALTAGVGVLDVPLFAACDGWACAEAARAHGCDRADAWGRQEQVWSRLGDPYRVAYARYRRGAALLAAGDRRGAARPLRQALQSANGLGAAPLVADVVATARRARIELTVGPGRAGVDEDVPDGAATVGLTRRECDVLERLMGGRSDRQIARELGISERTVGVHVSHVLGKLGVASRGEAAAVAHRTHLLETVKSDAVGSAAATQKRASIGLSPRTS